MGFNGKGILCPHPLLHRQRVDSLLSGNGFSGGLQFTPSTWAAFGGTEYAPEAWQASREQQIAVAQKVQAAQGWGAWPACTSKLGLR